MVYRTIGMIDAALADVDTSAAGASREIQKRIEEYAVECSILKVWGSEMLDMVVDHVVQIYRRLRLRGGVSRPSAPIAIRASTASSRAPTRSTASSSPAG